MMNAIDNVIETIRKRYSVRNYSDRTIEDDVLHSIAGYLDSNTRGPLGSSVRFRIVDGSTYSREELKRLGTYGLVTGARLFIAGAVNRNPFAMEDYGYCQEKNVLLATRLGLGTCWMGATLNRGAFAEKLALTDGEIIPAVTPIGYAEDKNTLKGSAVSFLMGSRRRKDFSELFFLGGIHAPLEAKECGRYAEVLESVRLAPSAGNLQPWRIIKDGEAFHFFLRENQAYNNYCDRRYQGARLQNIDIGIAMAHFELAAGEHGLSGVWSVSEPPLEKENLKYIATWLEE